MKKIITTLLSICMLFTLCSSNVVSAKTDNEEECQTCSIVPDDLENVIYEDKVYDENGDLIEFKAIVPLSVSEIPDTETRSSIGAILAIFKGAKEACRVTFYTTGGFNPCTYLAGVLGRKIINGIIQWQSRDNGKWDVTRTSHYGKIPGCEPMHAATCTGWYYTYSYKKIS